jgi:hypothetical protein
MVRTRVGVMKRMGMRMRMKGDELLYYDGRSSGRLCSAEHTSMI